MKTGITSTYSHYPILANIVANTKGPILELGCGYGSTYMLHELCYPTNRLLDSVDDKEEWISCFKHLESNYHQFTLIPKDKSWKDMLWYHIRPYSVVFVDHSKALERLDSAIQFINTKAIIVIHDSEEFLHLPDARKKIEGFKYKILYKQLEPQTLILANVVDVLNLIDLNTCEILNSANLSFPNVMSTHDTLTEIISGKYLGIIRVGDGEIQAMLNMPNRWENLNLDGITRELLEAFNNPKILTCMLGNELYWEKQKHFAKWREVYILSGLVKNKLYGDAQALGRFLEMSDFRILDWLLTQNIILVGESAKIVESDKLKIIGRVESPLSNSYDKLTVIEERCFNSVQLKTEPTGTRVDPLFLITMGISACCLVKRLVNKGYRAIDFGSLFNAVYRPCNSWHFRWQKDGQALTLIHKLGLKNSKLEE